MASPKRNEYLEADESHSEESGYDSEAVEERRLRSTAKRRKLSHDGGSEDESVDGARGSGLDEAQEQSDRQEREVVELEESAPQRHGKQDAQPREHHKRKSRLQENEQRGKSKAAHKPKSGVIYLSRIPPFMKPATVKHLLEPYGAITRVFLTPEDPQSHSTRVRHGGNKKRSFVDGWVEFLHKRDAKLVAETLNANIIGGKKGSYYHDDVWNMRYLRGFKWKDLTEQIKNENAERASRLRMEIAQTTRENKRYVENVEKGKMLERMEQKRKQRSEPEGNGSGPAASLKRDSLKDNPKSNGQPKTGGTTAERYGKKPSQKTEVRKVLDMVL